MTVGLALPEHQRGFAALVHAAEPARVIEGLPQLLVADAVVLADLHRHAATRARVAVAGNDDCFAIPVFRLVMLLSRRFCGLRTIEPFRRGVALEQFLFIRDVAHAAIRHAPLSISATRIRPAPSHQCTRSRVRSMRENIISLIKAIILRSLCLRRHTAYLRIRPFDVANEGLPTIVYMHMLDADNLVPASAQASQNFHLHRVSLHRASRSRSECRNPPLRSKSAVQLSEHRHCCRVGAAI